MSVDVAAERKKLQAFLSKHDPAKVGLTDELLKRFAPNGAEGIAKMWASLNQRYKVTDGGASPTSPAKSKSSKDLGEKAKSSKEISTKPGKDAVPEKSKSAGQLKRSDSASPTKEKKEKVEPKKETTKEPKKEDKAKEPSSPKRKASTTRKDDVGAASSPASPKALHDAATIAAQKARLQRYFQRNMPDRIGQIDAIITRVVTTDKTGEGFDNMWKAFTSKFGPEEEDEEANEEEAAALSPPPPPKRSEAPPSAIAGSNSMKLAAPIQPSGDEEQRQAPLKPSLHLGSGVFSPLSPEGRSTGGAPLKESYSNSGLVMVTSTIASPSVTNIEDDMQPGRSGGSLPVRAEERVKHDQKEAELNEWTERLQRYFLHYDPQKSPAEIRKAVESAAQSPNGLQQLWDTVVSHYGPEPPQPLSSMFRLMMGGTVKSPTDIAKDLISSSSSVGTNNVAPVNGLADYNTRNVNGSVFSPVNAAASRSVGAASKKKAWYQEDDDERPQSSAHARSTIDVQSTALRSGSNRGEPSRVTTVRAAPLDAQRNTNESSVTGVGPSTAIMYGILRFVGLDFTLFQRANEQAQQHFIRTIEQEISCNVDVDPSAVLVRRIIPNTAVDFKLDLTEQVRKGATDIRTAQHIGDVLVNRVLNGTFSLRLIRDSYRRDLNGVAADVFTQSCAVFGSESQQYYAFLPDEMGSNTHPPDPSYAAVTAAPAPPSQHMRPHDMFGTQSSSSPVQSRRNANATTGNTQTVYDVDIDRFTSKIHYLEERDKLPLQALGNTAGKIPATWNYIASANPLASTAAFRGAPRAGGDFSARMWDDDASELPEYQRRDETTRFSLDKPEAIDSTQSWNRMLSSFADPRRNAVSNGTRGLQHVREDVGVRPGGFTPGGSPVGRSSPKAMYGSVPSTELRGLQRIREASSSPHRDQSPRRVASGRSLTDNKHLYRKYDRTSQPPPSVGSPRSGHAPSPTRRGAAAYHSAILEAPIASKSPAAFSQPPRRSPERDGRVVAGGGVYSSTQKESSYRGFGREVPAIRHRMTAQFGDTPMNDVTWGGGGSPRESQLLQRSSETKPYSGRVAGEGAARWPTDRFSQQYRGIVGSLD